MSFIDMPGLNDVKEKYAVAEGPYDLTVISAKISEKEGKMSVQCILEIEGQPEAANVFHYLSIPGGDDDAEKKQTKMLFLKRFCNQFGIVLDNGLETEQIVGARATACKLTTEEYNGQLNNKFNPNQLPHEG